jgi:hypothetical protein
VAPTLVRGDNGGGRAAAGGARVEGGDGGDQTGCRQSLLRFFVRHFIANQGIDNWGITIKVENTHVNSHFHWRDRSG